MEGSKIVCNRTSHIIDFKGMPVQALAAFIYAMQGMGKEIASCLRSPVTQQCTKILIKAGAMNESVLP